MPDLTSINWFTAIPAWFGAALALFVFVRQLRRDRPRIRVTAENGLCVGVLGETSDAMLFLKAANAGHVAVTLQPPRFVAPNGKALQIVRTHHVFPHELAPGRGVTEWMPIRLAAHQLRAMGFSGVVRLVPEFRDQVGNTYSGKAWELDVAEWSRLREMAR